MKVRPFQLERYFAAHEFTAPHILCASDCESLSVQELLNLESGAADRLNNLWLGYTDSQGSSFLRRGIASLYSQIGHDQVVVHTGAEEAIFTFMNVTLDYGDHVIVHYPCYQSLIEIASSLGCEVTPWIAREEDDWNLDLDFLNDHVTNKTRVVVINSPHNPTGYVMPEEAAPFLIHLSQKYGFIIFSDEVYRFLEHGACRRLQPFCDLDHRAVSLGVMSKSFGLAGLRIGWIATRNRDVLTGIGAFKDYTTICNSAPGEFFAEVALRNREQIIGRNIGIIRDNMAVLNSFFSEHSHIFHWHPPQAGPIAFPSLKHTVSAEDLCRDLLHHSGVLLLPGQVYGKEYVHNFRIGFGRKNLPECIDRLENYLRDWG
jgi:aspartate/methionine/tyrosine aminotransferase